MTIESWQWLWDRRADTSPSPEGNKIIDEWLIELMAEQDYTVLDGVITKVG